MTIKTGFTGIAAFALMWVLGMAPLGEAIQVCGFNDSDLIIENVTLDPPVVKADEPLGISVTVANDGRVDVEERFDVTVKMDGSRIATFRVRLSFTQERTLETTWTAEAGDHTLTIEVDEPRDQIAECNERNNTFEQIVSVAPDSNLNSFNRSGLEAQAAGWAQAGDALALETSATNLLLLLDLVQQGFQDFSQAMSVITATLEPLDSQWPGAFAAENVFSPLIPRYQTIQQTADAIRTGLDTLDLDTAIAAMGEMETAFRNVASLASPLLPLALFGQAADTLALANDAALAAQQSFNSQGGADDDIADLISEVRALGDLFVEIARGLSAAAQAQSVSFLSADGQALNDLAGVATLNISAPVVGLRLEVVDARGSAVADLSTDQSVLEWNLSDNQGNPLPPGTYFYRASATDFADVGSILVP